MSPRSTFYVYSVMLSCALGLASAFVTGPARGALFRAAIAALVAFLITSLIDELTERNRHQTYKAKRARKTPTRDDSSRHRHPRRPDH